MTQQLDMLGMMLDDRSAARLSLPRPRDVRRRHLPDVLIDTPRAANADPETSHVAARRVKATGELGQQQFRVRGCVNLHPGFTSAELAAEWARAAGGTWEKYRPMFARRLPELDGIHVQRGEARMCRVTGSMCVTWWPR